MSINSAEYLQRKPDALQMIGLHNFYDVIEEALALCNQQNLPCLAKK